MYAEKDAQGLISIQAISPGDAEIIEMVLVQVIARMPESDQVRFRRLAIDFSKLTTNK